MHEQTCTNMNNELPLSTSGTLFFTCEIDRSVRPPDIKRFSDITDFPTGRRSQPCAQLEICEYQATTMYVTSVEKISNIGWLFLIM